MLSQLRTLFWVVCLLSPGLAIRINSYARQYQLPGVIGNSFGAPGANATYDYVVVGGGTAGLAITARLAQNFSVAATEAGSFYEIENGNGTIIPGLCALQEVQPSAPLAPLIDWNLQTLPMTGALNRSMYYARGKTLGGSSARNFFAYHRPTVGSMQQWADEVGDDSYTWSKVVPFFDRSVTIPLPNTINRLANSSIDFDDSSILTTSQDGPIQVTWPNYAPPVYSWFYRAFNAIGIVSNTQAFLGGIVDGISWTSSTMDPASQQRSTSQTGYMHEAMLETDIKVYTRTIAKKIIFNDNNTATGVLASTAGRDFHLSANKEVILSAGVGQDLWDHPFFPVTFAVNVQTMSRLQNDPEYAGQAAQDYIANQTGVLTAPLGMLAWERLTGRNLSGVTISAATTMAVSDFATDWPQIEYIVTDGPLSALPVNGRNYASLGVALITPLSRGYVTLRGADASDPPVININYLSNPADVELMINGLKRARTVWRGLANITTEPEVLPGPNITTDAQIEQYLRQTVAPVWHPSVTCKTGRSNDTMAVVDSRCRVYGTQNLRVVDASALPSLTPGHPQSVVYMLAEKIADDILYGT